MVKVEVKAELLKWAIRRSGRPAQDIEQKFPKIWEWITAVESPDLKQLEKFALFTYTPLGYFFLEKPPQEKLPIPLYRTINTQSSDKEISVNLLDTIHVMQSRQAWMREYLVERGASPLGFVGSADLQSDIIDVAQNLRNTLNLSANWASYYSTWTDALSAFRQAIEDVGILIVTNGIVGNNTHRKLDPQEFRGFVLVDEFAPLLFVNGADGKAAQMFTLAHELAHVIYGYSAAFDLSGALPADEYIEKLCDQVAAEFLVPAIEFKQAWAAEQESSNTFQKLARKFKVSEIVIARRALDLEYIDKDGFFDFYDRYQSEQRNAKTSQGGGDFYANQKFRVGKRFAKSIIIAAKEGSLLYSEAYRLTGLRGKTFDIFADSIGYEV